MKEVTTMNIDVVDVRLDERKLPYLVSETVAEYRGGYVGEQRLKVNSPEKVVNVLNNIFHMKDFSEEKLYVMFLSASLHVIAYAEIGHGVIDSATVGIREIMQRAFLTNAAGIILAHNHPGLGSTANPSTQDIDVTQGLMRHPLWYYKLVLQSPSVLQYCLSIRGNYLLL